MFRNDVWQNRNASKKSGSTLEAVKLMILSWTGVPAAVGGGAKWNLQDWPDVIFVTDGIIMGTPIPPAFVVHSEK